MAFKSTVSKSNADSPDFILSKQGLAGGLPLIATVEEIVDARTIKAKLVTTTLSTKEGTSVTIEQALAASDFRSLSSAIQGSEKVSPLRPGDLISFDKAYINKGRAAVGMVTGRTHDKMRGTVQAMVCMARLSKVSVSSKGMTQFVTIINPATAMVAEHLEHVKQAFKIVQDQKWPGGDPGFVVRQNGGGGIIWTLKKGEKFEALLEELEYNDVFQDGAKIELIPAWSLPAGRDLSLIDADGRKETQGSVLGPMSKLFVFDQKKGLSGFTPCLAVVGEEEEFAFGGPTGKVVRAVTALQPCFRNVPDDAMRVPSRVRKFDRTPNGIGFVWTDEQVEKQREGRISRRGPDPVIQKSTPNSPARPGAPGRQVEQFDDDNVNKGRTFASRR